MKNILPLFFLWACLLLNSGSAFAQNDSFDQVQHDELRSYVLYGTPVVPDSDYSRATVFLFVGSATCTGVAISQTAILTAAHCVEGLNSVSSIRVYSGAKKVYVGVPKSFLVHPAYGPQFGLMRADIAVLKMAPLPNFVVPAPLAMQVPNAGTKITAIGFGYSDPDKTRSGQLLMTNFVYGQTAGLSDERFSDGSRLLVFDGLRNICNGDSGGPSFVRVSGVLRVLGIHSMANCYSLGIDVLAPLYRKWILENAK